MKKFIAIFSIITSIFCSAKAQDTCFVALRIDNKTAPFEVKNDKDGRPSGFLTKGANGDIYLYTNRPYIKVINESGSEMRNKLTGEYRVITFENGSATTYDYSNKVEGKKWAFVEKKVKNFQNMIYFGGDIKENTFWFQLENNANYRRTFRTRSVFGEFDGLKSIDIAVVTPEGNDSVFSFGDSEKVDTLILTSGSSIKKIAATRGRNGLLNSISAGESTLSTKYTYRNTNGTFDEDNYSVRNATLTTTDEALNITFPCVLTVEYSYMEGDNNVQVDRRQIYIDTRDVVEESSSTWIWVLLVLLVLGGIGYYYYRRYQLKKAGIIPETDAEKVVRLQKEVATHTATIKGLEKTEADLLNDKKNLQNEVSKLNNDLQVSRQETKDKADESNSFKDALTKLQHHTNDIQGQLDEANERIKVFESNHEHIENLALHQQLNDLHLEMDNQKRADAEKLRNTIAQKDEERVKAVAEKQQELIAAQQKNEAELKAALNMQVDELNASLMKKQQELNEALAKKQQELEETKLLLAREKTDALAKLEGESSEAYNKMKRDLAAQLALLTQARQADLEDHESAIKTLQTQADQIIAQTKEKAASEIAAVKADAETKIAETNSKAAAEVADTKAKAAAEIAETKANAETAINNITDEKANALQQAAALLAATKADYEKRLADTVANADKTVADTKASADKAVADAKAYAERTVTEIRTNASTAVAETRDKALKEIEKTRNEAETQINDTLAKTSAELADLKAKYEAIIADTKAKAEAEVTETKTKAAAEIAETKEKAEAEVAETKANAEAAVNEANENAAREISEAKEKAQAEIARITEDCEKQVADEQEKTRKANEIITKAGDEYIAFLKSTVDKVFEQVSLLQSEASISPLDNNHKNVINHLSLKFTGFHQWFEKNIVQAQATNKWGVREIEDAMRKELIPTLTNNYSWMSELVRFYAYTSINRRFTEEFRKSFVPVDYVKSSYAEACTLFGKLGITLYLPHLFVDDFNQEIHKINNTPLINSYYPQGFIEYRAENRGLIYDMLRPGYSINGEVQQLPEVCVF